MAIALVVQPMSRGYSSPQVLGGVGIALGVLAMLAYPVATDALLRWKWLEESLHPGAILDPVLPHWLLVVGVVLIALGFYEMAKQAPQTP